MGDLVRFLIKEGRLRGLSRGDIVGYLGVSFPTLKRWEESGCIPSDKLGELATCVGYRLEIVLDRGRIGDRL